jgi:hypothetical protein
MLQNVRIRTRNIGFIDTRSTAELQEIQSLTDTVVASGNRYSEQNVELCNTGNEGYYHFGYCSGFAWTCGALNLLESSAWNHGAAVDGEDTTVFKGFDAEDGRRGCVETVEPNSGATMVS